MAQLSKRPQTKGRDIIDLVSGEPDFDTLNISAETANWQLTQVTDHYTGNRAIPDIRQAISRKFEREATYGMTLLGCHQQRRKTSIINTVLCLVNPGDEVIHAGSILGQLQGYGATG